MKNVRTPQGGFFVSHCSLDFPPKIITQTLAWGVCYRVAKKCRSAARYHPEIPGGVGVGYTCGIAPRFPCNSRLSCCFVVTCTRLISFSVHVNCLRRKQDVSHIHTFFSAIDLAWFLSNYYSQEVYIEDAAYRYVMFMHLLNLFTVRLMRQQIDIFVVVIYARVRDIYYISGLLAKWCMSYGAKVSH